MMSAFGRLRRWIATVVLGRPVDQSTPAEVAATHHNAADLRFVRYLIDYFEQSLRMARLARQRSDNPCVLEIAQGLLTHQPAHIEGLKACLRDWDALLEPTALDRIQHTRVDDPSAADRIKAADLAYFAAAGGTRFDIDWLKHMISAHRDAVGAARDEQAGGLHWGTIRIARRLESTQWKVLEPMLTCLRTQQEERPTPRQERT